MYMLLTKERKYEIGYSPYGCIVSLKVKKKNTLIVIDSTTRSPQRDRKDRNHKGKGRKKDKKKKGNG